MDFDGVRDVVAGVDAVWQWLALVVAGGVPCIESHGAAAIGVLVGVPPVVAVLAGIAGNAATVVATVTLGDRLRRHRPGRTGAQPASLRRRRLKERFDRYGVAGVSLVGPTILPSQLTAMAMVTFGADRRAVITWQMISVTLWGATFGALAALGIHAVG